MDNTFLNINGVSFRVRKIEGIITVDYPENPPTSVSEADREKITKMYELLAYFAKENNIHIR